MGAAGDQNPVHFGPIMGSAARQARMINSVGQIVGEEVIRVLSLTKRLNDNISIYGSQKIVTCPGRTRTDTDNREGKPGSYVDGDPVNIKLSLLLLGDIAFAGINAEAYNLIAQRLNDGGSEKKLKSFTYEIKSETLKRKTGSISFHSFFHRIPLSCPM